jgi:hypothetical protein
VDHRIDNHSDPTILLLRSRIRVKPVVRRERAARAVDPRRNMEQRGRQCRLMQSGTFRVTKRCISPIVSTLDIELAAWLSRFWWKCPRRRLCPNLFWYPRTEGYLPGRESKRFRRSKRSRPRHCAVWWRAASRLRWASAIDGQHTSDAAMETAFVLIEASSDVVIKI